MTFYCELQALMKAKQNQVVDANKNDRAKALKEVMYLSKYLVQQELLKVALAQARKMK
jgi:hypothetical protein